MLEKTMAAARGTVEIQVTGEDGRVLASSNPSRAGEMAQDLPSFTEWGHKTFLRQLREILYQRQDYVVAVPLGVRGQEKPIFSIRVLVSSVLLRESVEPQLRNLTIVSTVSLLLSVLLAIVFSNIALRPLAWVGQAIERMSRGENWPAPPQGGREAQEFVAVQSKLDVLGQQFRGAQADVTQMRTNVEKLLRNLEDGVLLFDKDRRLVLAGVAAERLLGRNRSEILGQPLEQVFPPSTELGAAIDKALRERSPLRDRAVLGEHDGGSPARLLLNLELLEGAASEERGGALVTLRDAESRNQIQTQLDVSSRIAAISKLTAGVAHEIKNPLNAMALHLEVLKSRIGSSGPEVGSEVEVIAREISRLDRVVKTFLDFTRPTEVRMEPVDLTELVAEVGSLVGLEAKRRRIPVELTGAKGVMIRGDQGLLRQALINIVVNGVESMKEGGHLRIESERKGRQCVVTVADEGSGIDPEVQDRVFNLYFTTKPEGSGIGLAIAFRVVQLHNGKIDFISQPGKGTVFHLVFPGLE
jgi:hypothetical protein